jgi:hypothetical protein
MTRIVVHRFGDVEESFTEKVLKIMNDCYDRIDGHTVEIVDLYLFDKSSAMNAFLNEEERKLGIETMAFEESFFAVHDAWHGTPRIMVSHDKMLRSPELIGIASLRHEVAHTVLHGSLEYYSFPMPMCLLQLERDGVISEQTMRSLLYLASIAVKDFEVTRLLYKNGYVEDQVAYSKYFLEPSEEEHKAWKLAEKNKTARLLFLVSLLKAPCCAAPLLEDEKYGKEIAESIARSLNLLPSELSTGILNILKAAPKLGENTHENLDLFITRLSETSIFPTVLP